jgi:hypothetical protein
MPTPSPPPSVPQGEPTNSFTEVIVTHNAGPPPAVAVTPTESPPPVKPVENAILTAEEAKTNLTNPKTQEIQELETEIADLVEIMGEEKLVTIAPFTLSQSAKNAVELLNTIDKAKTLAMAMNEDGVWCFRLLYQFANEVLPEDNS